MGLSTEFRTYKQYPLELKKQVVFAVLNGSMTKSEAMNEFGIGSITIISRWMERYGHGILSEHKELLLQMGTRKKAGKAAPATDDKEAKLQEEVARLQKELKAAELRAEAYSLMIDIAERELKVAIRKKSGTK